MGIQDILNVIVSLLMDANPDSALNAEASDLIHEVRFLENLAFGRPIDIVLSCAFTKELGRICAHCKALDVCVCIPCSGMLCSKHVASGCSFLIFHQDFAKDASACTARKHNASSSELHKHAS